ncbi:MAG: HAMP domain-containing sensor histidine kinase [Steroidobacteraceae bacterium]
MTSGRRSTVIFIVLGVLCVLGAVALNVGWILISWQTGLKLVLGVLLFAVIISGIVLNTIFLVREIRRSERHDAFINAVTHELKTPITSIRLYLETLQTRPMDESQRREFYQVMLRDSDRLLYTVEQVLRAGRTAPLKRPTNWAAVGLSELVRDCVELARARHHVQPQIVEFQDDLREEHAQVMGDPDELKSALSNLIDNAIKYSHDRLHVVVSLHRVPKGRYAVTVADEGIGISASELKRIFKRFSRVPGSITLRVKGTGLGLFIVKSIAKRHGGRVWAESAGAGRGSRFTLELPAAPAV